MRPASTLYNFNETNKAFPFKTFFHKLIWVIYHWHKEIEFMYITEGDMSYSVGGTCYELKKGDVGFACPGDIHGIVRANDTRLIVQFDLEILESKFFGSQDIKEILRKLNRLERVSLNWRDDVKVKIVDILLSLRKIEERPTRDAGYRIQIRRLLLELIELCFYEIPENDDQMENNPILDNKKVIGELDLAFEYVRNHYTENIRLNDIAQHLNYSPNYFTKFWKKYTGSTFHTYLNEFRIKEAIILLVDTNLPIWEICFKVGFKSQETFNRVFKSITGKSPYDYRTSHTS